MQNADFCREDLPKSAQRLIDHRRRLHQIAEPGFEEWQTLNYLVSCTKDLEGAKLHFVNHSEQARIEARSDLKFSEVLKEDAVKHFVLGEEVIIPSMCISFPLQDSGKVIAFRTDLDALPIIEEKSPTHRPSALGFVSATSCTHACGHDGHLAIALTLCELVPALKKTLIKSGIKELRFIFQSAEEGCQGARFLVHSSFLEGIDELYCFHLGMGLPSGQIAPNCTLFLSTLKFDLTFIGRKAHAGKPNEGINALKGLSEFILGGLALMDVKASRLINFNNVKVQGARNVIPDIASLEGEIRAKSSVQLKSFEALLSELIDKTLKANPGLSCRFKPRGCAIEIKSDQELTAKVARAAKAANLIIAPEFAFSASEDASLLIDKVQKEGGRAAYFVVGADIKAPHHHSAFDFDEGALLNGLLVLLDLLNPEI